MNTKQREARLRKIVRQGTEWKSQYGAEAASRKIWNVYGYLNDVKDGTIIIWGLKSEVLARI